ncbi:MAG TPA: hypoxanthine phosphoribosyltransferase [Cytophagaceae bacterium]
MKLIDKEFEIFIPEHLLVKRIKELGKEIDTMYKGMDPVFIAILNGAFMFAADLIKEITGPCKLSFIKVASYEGTVSSGKVNSLIGLEENLEGKNVVLIDDIVDTGITMSYVIEQVQAFKPASLEVATLLLKPEAFNNQFQIKFVGFTIPNDFVVGYGLDYNGYGRNLREIYHIKN